MTKIFATVLSLLLSGCAAVQEHTASPPALGSAGIENCKGTVELPAHLAEAFIEVRDSALLLSSLGEPEKGKLCQGQVYQLKQGAELTLYRTWNSTNPRSRLGSWWTFNEPQGSVTRYREALEICYQWSPLDRMVKCSVAPGTKLVVGNGQSAQCSDFLKYGVSDAQQVYFDNADANTFNCSDFDAQLLYTPVTE